MNKINISTGVLLMLWGCSPGSDKTNSQCNCPIPESVDNKTEKDQDNSDQTWVVGANGGVEAVVKKAVDAKISVSGSYLNANSKIEEVFREIIGSNPKITQKANLYRSIACAYYEIACQDKILSDREKIERLNEIVAGYEQNINRVLNEEKINEIKKEQLEPQKENMNPNAVRGENKNKKDETETKDISTTHVEKIENKGNLSIGQTGGIVNQTMIVNPKEKFTDEEKREIIRNINLRYRAVGQDGAKCVQLIPNSYRSESHQLCDDLEAFLKEQGYIIAPNSGNILNWGKVDDRVTYRVSENSCMSLVISY